MGSRWIAFAAMGSGITLLASASACARFSPADEGTTDAAADATDGGASSVDAPMGGPRVQCPSNLGFCDDFEREVVLADGWVLAPARGNASLALKAPGTGEMGRALEATVATTTATVNYAYLQRGITSRAIPVDKPFEMKVAMKVVGLPTTQLNVAAIDFAETQGNRIWSIVVGAQPGAAVLAHLVDGGGYESKKLPTTMGAWSTYTLTVTTSEATLAQGETKITLPHPVALRGPSILRFGVAYSESQAAPATILLDDLIMSD